MPGSENPLQRFLTNHESKVLAEELFERQILNEDRRDALYLALIDIAESMQKLYADIIPGVLEDLSDPGSNIDEINDKLFDLRSEFRHIDYHVHDAELHELEWWSTA